MTINFSQKLIQIKVQLVQVPETNQPGVFTETGTNTVTLEGSRMSVQINNSGSLNSTEMTAKVYGLTPSLMNQLSTLGQSFNLLPRNKIVISAGDTINGLSTIFTGIISSAYGDFNSAPDVPFYFTGNAGQGDSTISTIPTSFSGPTDVATMMAGFANRMNVGFENNGVSVQLNNPYYDGNIWQQVQKCKRDAHINADRFTVGGASGEVLAIWPVGGNRNTPDVQLISKDTGMIGYPSYTNQGIKVDAVFNPKLARGQLIQVQSSLFRATGMWTVTKLDHFLETLLPKGQWKSSMLCYNPKHPLVIPPSS
jgi:hypothetical protein